MKEIKPAILAVAVLVLFSQSARAREPEVRVRAILGYKFLRLDDYRFSHDTHPDDYFLPDSNIPGSAGTTCVGGRMGFLALGGGYQFPLSTSIPLYLGLDLGVLRGGKTDRHQNANDPRPAANAAFVRSNAVWGGFAAVAVSYHIDDFFIGAEAQFAGVVVEHGWDRYERFQSRWRKLDSMPSAGLKAGYSFSDADIEVSTQFGRAVTFGIQVAYKF
ncbi:MAG: hypothetical protein LBD14_01040 [Puniceicoccales bacterium]|jgi:hypothetical protein|nr:hypothetical protein [Puniceicoccales bacterium]